MGWLGRRPCVTRVPPSPQSAQRPSRLPASMCCPALAVLRCNLAPLGFKPQVLAWSACSSAPGSSVGRQRMLLRSGAGALRHALRAGAGSRRAMATQARAQSTDVLLYTGERVIELQKAPGGACERFQIAKASFSQQQALHRVPAHQRVGACACITPAAAQRCRRPAAAVRGRGGGRLLFPRCRCTCSGRSPTQLRAAHATNNCHPQSGRARAATRSC